MRVAKAGVDHDANKIHWSREVLEEYVGRQNVKGKGEGNS
jgi:hypothetical protein